MFYLPYKACLYVMGLKAKGFEVGEGLAQRDGSPGRLKGVITSTPARVGAACAAQPWKLISN